MRIVNEKQLTSLMDMKEIIQRVEVALEEYSSGRTNTPIRTALPYDDEQNTALFMPSVADGLQKIGVKVVTVAPNNKDLGKKLINGFVALSNYKTGEPVAILEGSYLTMIRTGAISGVATKYLAKQNATTLAIIGTGEQAFGLAAAVFATRDIKDVHLYNRSKDKAEAFAHKLQHDLSHSVNVHFHDQANDAIAHAEIVVTATNSSTPVYSASLRPGTHVNAVGSFRPTMQELPTHTVTDAHKVVVEAVDAALEETGDLITPIENGDYQVNQIHGELGKIVSGELSCREHDEEITVFKSVGLAIVDIVVANYFYEKAIETNTGTDVDF